MNALIITRRLMLVNTDPQRRCYNGAHKSTANIWGQWEELEWVATERAEERMTFWKELNEYAVSQRGKENTLREFKIQQEK